MRALIASTLLSTFLLGCSSAAAPPGPKLSSIQAAIFTPSCALSSCHSSGSAAGGMVLEDGKSFANLVGVAAQQIEAAQGGLLRVSPGDPAHSFLLMKLEPGLNASYGDHMPDNGQQLDAADLAAISDWIAQGAQND